jgi:D-arabinose 1-dehydrogenase-like Zn-dependent alcohol dehydrogenase
MTEKESPSIGVAPSKIEITPQDRSKQHMGFRETLTAMKENITSTVSHKVNKLSEKIGITQDLKIEKGHMSLKYTHPTYTIVDNPKDADAVAWSFLDHFTAGQVFFKFPPIKSEEIRIDITYFGLCHSDCMWVQEEWLPVKNYPYTPGHEIVGIVKEVGSGVKDFKIGDRVGFGCQRWCCGKCKPCSKNFENICSTEGDQKWTYGERYWGGYATSLQQPADFFFPLPKEIPDELLPSVFCAGATVYGAIQRHIKPGEKVAVLGIGGLGHLAIQYAKAWGCEVSAFTRTTDKIPFIQKLGNFEIFDTNDPTTLELENGKYDSIISTLPISDNKLLEKELMLLGPFGKFVIVGGPSTKDPHMMPVLPLHFRHISIHYNWIASRKEIYETLEFSKKHNIWPTIEMYSFEDWPKAYQKLLSGRPLFRNVVRAEGYLEKVRSQTEKK